MWIMQERFFAKLKYIKLSNTFLGFENRKKNKFHSDIFTSHYNRIAEDCRRLWNRDAGTFLGYYDKIVLRIVQYRDNFRPHRGLGGICVLRESPRLIGKVEIYTTNT